MRKAIKSLSNAVIRQAIPSTSLNEKLLEKVGTVLNQRIERMPWTIRMLILTSTLIFDWTGVIGKGRKFSDQNLEMQKKSMAQLENSHWKFSRQFIKFYQKFSLYIYYALEEELKA